MAMIFGSCVAFHCRGFVVRGNLDRRGDYCQIFGPGDKAITLVMLPENVLALRSAPESWADSLALALGRIIAAHGLRPRIAAVPAGSQVTSTEVQAVTWDAGRRFTQIDDIEARAQR